ncbi:MAG: hypothetical protein AAFX96_13560 [Pseudomonadota bacterium]
MNMMKFETRKRIEILADRPFLREIRKVASDTHATQFTVLATIGGQNEKGFWHDDQVTGGAGSKIVFIALLQEETADRFLEALAPLIEQYGLFVSVSDTKTVIPEPGKIN